MRHSQLYPYILANTGDSSRLKSLFLRDSLFLTENTIISFAAETASIGDGTDVVFTCKELKDLLSNSQTRFFTLQQPEMFASSHYHFVIADSLTAHATFSREAIGQFGITYQMTVLNRSFLEQLDAQSIVLMGSLTGGTIIDAIIYFNALSSAFIDLRDGGKIKLRLEEHFIDKNGFKCDQGDVQTFHANAMTAVNLLVENNLIVNTLLQGGANSRCVLEGTVILGSNAVNSEVRLLGHVFVGSSVVDTDTTFIVYVPMEMLGATTVRGPLFIYNDFRAENASTTIQSSFVVLSSSIVLGNDSTVLSIGAATTTVSKVIKVSPGGRLHAHQSYLYNCSVGISGPEKDDPSPGCFHVYAYSQFHRGACFLTSEEQGGILMESGNSFQLKLGCTCFIACDSVLGDALTITSLTVFAEAQFHRGITIEEGNFVCDSTTAYHRLGGHLDIGTENECTLLSVWSTTTFHSGINITGRLQTSTIEGNLCIGTTGTAVEQSSTTQVRGDLRVEGATGSTPMYLNGTSSSSTETIDLNHSVFVLADSSVATYTVSAGRFDGQVIVLVNGNVNNYEPMVSTSCAGGFKMNSNITQLKLRNAQNGGTPGGAVQLLFLENSQTWILLSDTCNALFL